MTAEIVPRWIVCKALYKDDKLIEAKVEGRCGIDPTCWKSKETDSIKIARILSRRAGRADCPGKNGCRLHMYFHEDGSYVADHVTPKPDGCFEHTITYVKIEGLPKFVYMK